MPARTGADRRPLFARAPIVVLVVLAYIGVLHYAYVNHIAPLFSYLQYAYRDPDPVYYGIAIGVTVLLALLLPREIRRPSHMIAWLLYLVAVLPGIIVPQMAPALDRPEAFRLGMWVGGCFLLVVLLGTRRTLRGFIPLAPMTAANWWRLIGAFWVGLNLIVLAYAGVKWSLPSFEDVYSVRGEFRATESSDPALAYVVPMLDKIINPLLILRGLVWKRWLALAAGVLGQLYLYSLQGNKTAVLAPVALLAAYFFLKRRHPVGPTILGAGVLGSIVIMTIDLWQHSNDLTSLFIRRVLVTPGIVLMGYVQTFDPIPKAKLGYSILSDFFPYPYQKEPPDLVGAEFFDNPFTHANASWLADGYANFGYAGMLGATIILVLLLWAIDDATRGLDRVFSCLIFVMPGLALAESAILTAILTHGFFFAIVLCALAPRAGPVDENGQPEREHPADPDPPDPAAPEVARARTGELTHV
ncbi:hypothetical protein [Pseudonocardia sp.]|uniref:hypothetical protein n=1 Tax=Pseudonocardia sp. TaxID=60912 RepID=UPI003D0E73C3